MKKIVHATAVYGPMILCGAIVSSLLLLAFGWVFIPYNGYVWCGVLTAISLLVCHCAKSDYMGKIPRIEENGILIFATLISILWIYIQFTVEYKVFLPFGISCIAFGMYNAVKLCEDTVKRTLSLMVGATMSLVTFLILFAPLLSPIPIIKDLYSVYNGQGIVAKTTVKRDAGNVFDIIVLAKRTSGDLGLGRLESVEEVYVTHKIVDVKEYRKPRLVWKGEDLYIDGEKMDIYWK